jgi:DNA-3-methyladenine glycosylase I
MGRTGHDERKLFEFLILEGAQAGLSWTTIPKKRENYRKAFDEFHAEAGRIRLIFQKIVD